MTLSDGPSRDIRALLRTDTTELPCGANVDDLLEQAADGHAADLTPHQQSCPHCQAALGEFARVWEPVHTLAAEPVSVPAALKTIVSDQIRKLIADTWYTLQHTDDGAIRIAARVVATLARDAARTVPGVRVAFGRHSYGQITELAEKATLGHRAPHAAIGVLGRTAVIDLALAVRHGEVVDEVACQVQQRVITQLRATVGGQDVTVNLHRRRRRSLTPQATKPADDSGDATTGRQPTAAAAQYQCVRPPISQPAKPATAKIAPMTSTTTPIVHASARR